MNKELILEHYLSQLDRELQALPTGQRAEIITEIRSHILDKSAADANQTMQNILNGMGSPKEVAARYLEQKGVKPWTPSPARNWLKWIAISFAAMVAFVIVSTIATIWYFSPLISVDEKAGRVTLLGGVIDVNEKTGEVKVGGIHVKEDIDLQISSKDNDYTFRMNNGGANRSEGERDLSGQNVRLIKIPFNTAKIAVVVGLDGKFKWDCKNMGSNPPPLTINAGVMTFDLNKVSMAKCELSVPEAVKVELKGVNGSLSLDEPRSDLDIHVTNGKIGIRPDRSKVYDFEVKVLNGMHDNFDRSSDKQALKVKVDVVNGVVKKE